MLKIIRKIIKKIKCEHEYKLHDSKVINGSIPKYCYQKCKKCGKEKSVLKW